MHMDRQMSRVAGLEPLTNQRGNQTCQHVAAPRNRHGWSPRVVPDRRLAIGYQGELSLEHDYG